jgi:hypothetical protein
MHRYIPYLAKNAGFNKIGEKVVKHQARKFGSTKFGGLNRFVNGYLDLLSLYFLNTFGLKPMHVFGFIGTLMFFFGFVACIIVGAGKIIALCNNEPARLVTESPYFYIALTMMILGTQLFVAGFLILKAIFLMNNTLSRGTMCISMRYNPNCSGVIIYPHLSTAATLRVYSRRWPAYRCVQWVFSSGKDRQKLYLPLPEHRPYTS